MTRVLITCRQMQNCFEAFRGQFDERGIDYVMPEVVQQPSENELIAIIGDYDGMIAGDDPLSARVLEQATRMRIISKWGVGVDGIDLEAAERLGIRVTNTPGVFGDDVADVALGYVVMLARQLHRIDAAIRGGVWWKHEGVRLAGRTLGVSGFGTIGRAVARRAQAFGMHVVAFDVDQGALEKAKATGVRPVELEELFEASDFLILCNPLTSSNVHMVGRETLGAMREGSYVVNVARGPLVDEDALVIALASGHIAGAALDVFESEPLPERSPLRAFPQCVFGSHNGSNTSAGVLQASERAVAHLFEGLGA